MNKIGILTYHNTTNFGALLQAFALQSKLNELGADSEIINYHCENIEKREHVSFPKFNMNLLKYLLEIRAFILSAKKRKKMNKFSKKFMLISENEYTRENINESNKIYDKFVVGSDMVFNLDINGGDMSFYLDFADDDKRYSYAACLGKKKIEDKYFRQCKEELEKFNHISVRENQTKDYLSNILNNKVYVDIDPTLLYDGTFWKKYEEQPKEITKKKYILLYFVSKGMPEIEIAKKIAKKQNLDIYVLSSNKTKIEGCKVIHNASVGEFLYYIHNAFLVITASFHGMIFSMNYNTNFMYFNKNKTATKLNDMASITNSKDRELKKDYIPNIECNFKKINKAVNNIRNKSIEYLNSLVNDERR